MSERVSLIGGIITFVMVVVLSLLCLDMEGDQGLFMCEPTGSEVNVL